MSGTDLFKPESYRDIATLNGQAPVLFRQYGGYQGDWLLFSRDEENYYLWKDSYGSCSGCDNLQSIFDYNDAPSNKSIREFLDQYNTFAEIPKQTAVNLVKAGTFEKVFPKNLRGEYSDIDGLAMDEWIEECVFAVKVYEDLDITTEEILGTKNQELRREAIERTGIESFFEGVKAIELDVDERGDKLMSWPGESEVMKYLWLKDGSTDREYVLRVPPETAGVTEGKAWSFDVEVYAPIIET